jgi:outer membrane lipoprotein
LDVFAMKKIKPVFHLLSLSFILFTAILLNACATSPKFDIVGIDATITPQRAVIENQSLQGEPVLWGGVVIVSTNLKDSTQIEILAYPLDSNQRPNREQEPLGRFLAEHVGYLETTDYAQGRLITIKGTLGDQRSGRVGEAEYVYPVVTIMQQHLWSGSSKSQVQFGFGLMFHN